MNENTPVVPSYNPPMTFEAQIERMSMKQLKGEVKKRTKEPGLNGALAMILTIAIFKEPISKNDPYVLDRHSKAKGGFDMQKTGPRPPKAGK